MSVVAEILAELIRDLPGITHAGVVPTYATHDEFGTYWCNIIDFSNGYFCGHIEHFDNYCTCWSMRRNKLEYHYYGDPAFPDSVLTELRYWALNKRS